MLRGKCCQLMVVCICKCACIVPDGALLMCLSEVNRFVIYCKNKDFYICRMLILTVYADMGSQNHMG